MSRDNLLPSHTQLLLNKITNWASIIALILVIIVGLSWYTITYSIKRDCNNPYSRSQKLGSYWLTINAGSTKTECPQPVTYVDD